MLRNTMRSLRTWIETKSLAARIGILIVALIAFRIGQMLASVAETLGDVGVLLVGIPVIVLVLVSLYAIGVVIWSFVSDVRGPTESA